MSTLETQLDSLLERLRESRVDATCLDVVMYLGYMKSGDILITIEDEKRSRNIVSIYNSNTPVSVLQYAIQEKDK